MDVWKQLDDLLATLTPDAAVEYFTLRAYCQRDWPSLRAANNEAITHSAVPGVYAFVVARGEGIERWLYVGSATRAIGGRVWRHRQDHPQAFNESTLLLTLPCRPLVAVVLERLLIEAGRWEFNRVGKGE